MEEIVLLFAFLLGGVGGLGMGVRLGIRYQQEKIQRYWKANSEKVRSARRERGAATGNTTGE